MKATKKILVIEAGWVLIGMASEPVDGIIKVTDASVIRRWGTTNGLGQIALTGPTENTIFDACGEVDVPVRALLFTIKCVV